MSSVVSCIDPIKFTELNALYKLKGLKFRCLSPEHRMKTLAINIKNEKSSENRPIPEGSLE